MLVAETFEGASGEVSLKLELGDEGFLESLLEESDALCLSSNEGKFVGKVVGNAPVGIPGGKLKEGKLPEPKPGSSVGNPGGRLMVGVPG